MKAYHYTTAQNARSIVDDLMIRPATEGIQPGERPVVWFSRARTWEQTACKGVIDQYGRNRTLTFREMVPVGLVRFAMPLSALVPWAKLPALIGMRRSQALRLERAARKMGGVPSDWYASMDAVPYDRIEGIDFYVKDRWVPGHELANAMFAEEAA